MTALESLNSSTVSKECTHSPADFPLEEIQLGDVKFFDQGEHGSDDVLVLESSPSFRRDRFLLHHVYCLVLEVRVVFGSVGRRIALSLLGTRPSLTIVVVTISVCFWGMHHFAGVVLDYTVSDRVRTSR